MLALVETRWAAPTVFAAGVVVWWIQAIAMPLAGGRDFGTYVGAYVELFQRHPIDLGYVLGRTPIAPLFTGALLDAAGGALAEPAMSVVYALSITAWFLAARRFGPLVAVLVAIVLLVYPSYGILFHELASDSVFAAAFAGWALLAVITVLEPSPLRFGLVGVGIALLVLVRPGNQALLALALVPLVLALPWRTRIASSVALIVSASALLGLWAIHNGVLYGKYTVATGANSRLPFERAFLTDRIVRPENGAASERLAALVRRDLLPAEPYRSYGVGLDDFFADPSPRMIVDLTSLSNRLWGWKADARILRDVGIEAVRAHPGAYARGVTTTVWDLLWQPVYRPGTTPARGIADGERSSVTVDGVEGDTIVVNGRRLPKPTEGERIPAPHEQSPTTPDGGNYTVWTSPTERHVVWRNPRDEQRVQALGERISELAANLPDRSWNGTFALRINQASHRFPPPIFWLAIGIVALLVRRPAGALAAMTPAIAGLIVIVLNALAIPAVPHYSVPVVPAFVLLAMAALCSRSATVDKGRASDYLHAS